MCVYVRARACVCVYVCVCVCAIFFSSFCFYLLLQHNSSVHTLNIADNRLGSTGTGFITEALRENRSLADLVGYLLG